MRKTITDKFLQGKMELIKSNKIPDKKLNLKLDAPIKTWDEAIPLGNGLMGGLLWGNDNLLRLSLDRGERRKS
ncbi:MAG: hypothetical protein NT118_02145 [Lentisphaerae bacterium]|nr:hypothetical protein [Lentisphaerota bacterium]